MTDASPRGTTFLILSSLIGDNRIQYGKARRRMTSENPPTMSPGQKAKRTPKWAVTMTKWLLTRASVGTAWQVVRFCGPNGSESRGIVDLTAVRKGHRLPCEPLKRGDLFEIVLIQVKGGDAAWTDAKTSCDCVWWRKSIACALSSWRNGRKDRPCDFIA
jgi:hypothetical protein